ncbi:hypothetical protein U1Q18_014076, partial [Sarracenia purpurea var. burkii]
MRRWFKGGVPKDCDLAAALPVVRVRNQTENLSECEDFDGDGDEQMREIRAAVGNPSEREGLDGRGKSEHWLK